MSAFKKSLYLIIFSCSNSWDKFFGLIILLDSFFSFKLEVVQFFEFKLSFSELLYLLEDNLGGGVFSGLVNGITLSWDGL